MLRSHLQYTVAWPGQPYNVQEFVKNTQALRVINSFCPGPFQGNCRGGLKLVSNSRVTKRMNLSPNAERLNHILNLIIQLTYSYLLYVQSKILCLGARECLLVGMCKPNITFHRVLTVLIKSDHEVHIHVQNKTSYVLLLTRVRPPRLMDSTHLLESWSASSPSSSRSNKQRSRSLFSGSFDLVIFFRKLLGM